MNHARTLGLVPHLFVKDIAASLSFYAKAFGAVELFRNVLPDGTVLFVELAVGDARLLLSEEIPQLDALAPGTVGGTPMLLTLETTAPDGHRWALTTKREQFTPQDIDDRTPPEV
ncbi:VOC family protein [Amycolatopsis sp. NPDC059657]|uniref:VOC family protein n=1 Tax=Amycolatopsis sp. NPDC059657 TaxID=3346899 RepID=UPI00367168CF